MKSKYIVTTGVYKGYEFIGYELNGRIIDDQTIGRSYPVANCRKITDYLKIK